MAPLRALTWAPGAVHVPEGETPRLARKQCPGDNGGKLHREDTTEAKQSQVPACGSASAELRVPGGKDVDEAAHHRACRAAPRQLGDSFHRE